MLSATLNASRRLHLAFLFAAPLALAHCGGSSDTWTDPSNAVPAAKLEITQPADASGHVAENPVGQPVSVQITMLQTGPGTCVQHSELVGCGSIGSSSDATCVVCSGPDTPLDFQLTDITCDDDLCDIVSVQHGDPKAGQTVTLVPHAGLVTVHATATSGSLVATGSLQVAANCAGASNVPGCE